MFAPEKDYNKEAMILIESLIIDKKITLEEAIVLICGVKSQNIFNSFPKITIDPIPSIVDPHWKQPAYVYCNDTVTTSKSSCTCGVYGECTCNK